MKTYKKFFIKATTAALTFSLLSVSVSAESNSTAQEELVQTEIITNTEQLIETIKEINESKEIEQLTSEERDEVAESILENVTDEVVADYEEQMMEEVKEGSEQLDLEELNETGFASTQVTLSDGSEVEYVVSDVSEDDGYVLQGQSLSPNRSETKAYGDRRFTATITFTSLGATVGKLVLSNHYSVGDYGLKMRYVSKAGTESYISPFAVEDASAEVTDSKAEKVGYDINGLGEYKVKGGAGLFSGIKYFEIRSTIKLEKLDKSKKTAYVKQTYSFLD